MNKRLHRAHGQPGRFGGEKVSCCCRDLNVGSSSSGLVTLLTTIFGLSTLSEVTNNSDKTIMLSKLISAVKVSYKCTKFTISVFSWTFQ